MAIPSKIRAGIIALFTVAMLVAPACAQLTSDMLVTKTFWVIPVKFEAANLLRTVTAEDIQEVLANAGVKVASDPLKEKVGPNDAAMFWNDRTGALTVRASLADMDKIEKVLAGRMNPPQVLVETRFIEMAGADFPEQIQRPQHGITNLAVLTERQFREAMQAKGGADVVTPPTVTTISGRQARISVEQTRTLIHDTPPPLPRDTRPDADPTPLNKGRLPFPPNFQHRQAG